MFLCGVFNDFSSRFFSKGKRLIIVVNVSFFLSPVISADKFQPVGIWDLEFGIWNLESGRGNFFNSGDDELARQPALDLTLGTKKRVLSQKRKIMMTCRYKCRVQMQAHMLIQNADLESRMQIQNRVARDLWLATQNGGGTECRTANTFYGLTQNPSQTYNLSTSRILFFQPTCSSCHSIQAAPIHLIDLPTHINPFIHPSIQPANFEHLSSTKKNGRNQLRRSLNADDILRCLLLCSFSRYDFYLFIF